MSESDLDVALVTSWETKGGIATYAGRLVEALEDRGVGVHPVPVGDRTRSNPLAYADLVSEVPEAADLVHVQFEAGLFGRLGTSGIGAPAFFRALGRVDRPAVTTLHEVHRTHTHRGPLGDRLLRGRDAVVERTALRASEAVVVHTREAREILRERHGGGYRIERMLHPADADADPRDPGAAKADLGLEGDVLLTFGWVEPKKRYGEVIRALPDLPGVTYLIAGEPRERHAGILDDLRETAAGAGVADRVEFAGYVAEDDVPTVFSAADAVVLPYRRVAQSGVVNDALAYRRPVVAAGLPAFEELREEFDCLLTYDDRDGMVEAIDRALHDDGCRDRLRRRAGDYLATVSWENFAGRTVDLYGSIR